ncbi:hypothetical protein WMY93_002372 [Mugilogobius chulae]|uniref:Uncharacterized protein n=1 Tax=Mugilogobius chulae TaxID=88201 RepID=A0AAW0PZG1_9GOBI
MSVAVSETSAPVTEVVEERLKKEPQTAEASSSQATVGAPTEESSGEPDPQSESVAGTERADPERPTVAQQGAADAETKAEPGSENQDETKKQQKEEPASSSQPTDRSTTTTTNSSNSHLLKPEQPDLTDPSSRSSFTSQDGTEEYNKMKGEKDPAAAGETQAPSVNKQPLLCSLLFKSDSAQKTQMNNFFKLGQEGKYRVYHNQYSTNTLALNKHQHREEHDKRRHLSHKFSLTTAAEFKWNGTIHGSRALTVATLRLNITQLETNVPGPFMHPNWASHRNNWNKAVQMCSKAREFALALAILECAIKPVVMLPVWKESLGHTRLLRMTSMEREEKEKVKKREKKLEDEETLQQATWVKYTIPIKHQVWKQKGEEYRVTGYGGWNWVSKTRVPRFVPRLPGNTNVNYRKELEGTKNASEMYIKMAVLSICFLVYLCAAKMKENAAKKKAVKSEKQTEPKEEAGQASSSVEPKQSSTEDGQNPKEKEEQKDEKEVEGKQREEKMEVEPSAENPTPAEENKEEESKPYYDVVNVSQGFQLRTAYKKKVKPSRLDSLLERRVKQFTFEEKIRLEKLRQAALVPKISTSKPATVVKTEPAQPSTVKSEDGVQVKDHVVKKLNFETEPEIKTDHETTLKSGNGESSIVNGESISDRNNGLSETADSKEITTLPENAKKRAFDEVEQDDKSQSLQVNGKNMDANFKIDAQEVQDGVKEPAKETVKSLMNGNLCQNDAHAPPSKIQKLDNHVMEASKSEEIKDEAKNTANNLTNEASKPTIPTTHPASQKAKLATNTASSMISKEYSTRERVSLQKFSKGKKLRSGTALPSYRKFVTKSSKKSIFVLPNDDLKRLARRGGFREVPIFNYNAKPALDIWPYPSPRPTYGMTWRYRLQTVKSLAGVSLMLRLLWACLRWDDMAVKPSAAVGTTRKETTDTDIITTEIIKRRDVGPYGICSEYCIRKIICPLVNRDTSKETPTPQRKGLRSSALRPKKQQPAKQSGPVAVETWISEEDLELWEIKAFAERVEREKAQGADPSKIGASLKTVEEVKAHLENQLKQARLAAQQKRLEQQRLITTAGTPTTATASPSPAPLSAPASSTSIATISTTPTTPSTPLSTGQRPGMVTPGTKMVLASKLGSPAPFQQDKNFEQSYMSWVKQGQNNNGGTENQKGTSIFPSGPPANLRTYSTLHPTTGNMNLRASAPTTAQPQVVNAAGPTLQPQPGAAGAAVLKSPAVAPPGQAQTTASLPAPSPSPTMAAGQTPTAPQTPRPQQGQVKLTMAQLMQLTQSAQEGNPGLTVVIQGQGQTQGQLQIVPQGVAVIPGPGQQLMQAAMPNGQVQRFLFTPLPPSSTPAAAATTTMTPTKPAPTPAAQTPVPIQPRPPAPVQTTPSALAQTQMSAPLPTPISPPAQPVPAPITSTPILPKIAPQIHSTFPISASSIATQPQRPLNPIQTITQLPTTTQVLTPSSQLSPAVPPAPIQHSNLTPALTQTSPAALSMPARLPPQLITPPQELLQPVRPAQVPPVLAVKSPTQVVASPPASVAVNVSVPVNVPVPTPAVAPVSAPVMGVTQAAIPSPARAQIQASIRAPLHAAAASAVVTPVTATATTPSVPETSTSTLPQTWTAVPQTPPPTLQPLQQASVSPQPTSLPPLQASIPAPLPISTPSPQPQHQAPSAVSMQQVAHIPVSPIQAHQISQASQLPHFPYPKFNRNNPAIANFTSNDLANSATSTSDANPNTPASHYSNSRLVDSHFFSSGLSNSRIPNSSAAFASFQSYNRASSVFSDSRIPNSRRVSSHFSAFANSNIATCRNPNPSFSYSGVANSSSYPNFRRANSRHAKPHLENSHFSAFAHPGRANPVQTSSAQIPVSSVAMHIKGLPVSTVMTTGGQTHLQVQTSPALSPQGPPQIRAQIQVQNFGQVQQIQQLQTQAQGQIHPQVRVQFQPRPQLQQTTQVQTKFILRSPELATTTPQQKNAIKTFIDVDGLTATSGDSGWGLHLQWEAELIQYPNLTILFVFQVQFQNQTLPQVQSPTRIQPQLQSASQVPPQPQLQTQLHGPVQVHFQQQPQQTQQQQQQPQPGQAQTPTSSQVLPQSPPVQAKLQVQFQPQSPPGVPGQIQVQSPIRHQLITVPGLQQPVQLLSALPPHVAAQIQAQIQAQAQQQGGRSHSRSNYSCPFRSRRLGELFRTW